MRKAFFLFLFTTCCISVVFSQIDERVPGYILPYDGDTIHGYIKVKNNITSTKKCLFSQDQEGEFKVYTPKEISEYKMEGGKYYVTKKFTLDDKETLLFVEFLVNGIVNLYYFRMADKERYLLEKEGEPLTVIEGSVVKRVDFNKDDALLHQSKRIKGLEHKSSANFASKSKSQGLIAYLLQEDPTIQQKVKTLQFDQRSMIKLTKNYHDRVCDDYECIVYNKETNLSKRSIGLFIGANMGNMVFKTDDSHVRNLVEAEITRKPKPVIGLNFSSTIPYVSTKMVVDLYLSYSQHYFEYYYNGNSQTISKYSYNQIAVTGQLGYYLIRQEKFTLNPSVGLSGFMLFNAINDREIIGGFDLGPYRILPTGAEFLISTNLGLHASYMINDKYELKPAILYEFTYNMDDISLSSNNHVFYFMVGISKSLNRGK